MKFTKHWSKKKTAQTQPIPGSGQVQNSAGGFTWELTPWDVLDRFLILGSEHGTYYVAEQKLTEGHAKNLIALIKSDGKKVVDRIVEVSEQGRAPKNDPAIFALAMASAYGDTETRQAAFAVVPKVCRTGTHLFQFVAEAENLRGWGRGMRTAIQRWYNAADADDLTYQAIKYQQRGGWSHRDLLRLAHPKPASDAHRALYKWIVDGTLSSGNARLEAFEKLKATRDAKDAVSLIREYNLPRECVPTELLSDPVVWDALLESMPITALIRNLANMTRVGLLTARSDATKRVIARLEDAEALKRGRVHPIAILLAQATYAQGHGMRGSNTWATVPRIVDSLDGAFKRSFAVAGSTGKRFLLGVDVSGSMSGWTVAGTPLTACEAATAMAMVTMSNEPYVMPMAFAHNFRKLPLTPKMSLTEALRHTQNQNFGGTDCSLPMRYALQKKLDVDAFVVYTDNETWAGPIHPSQALEEYRHKTGIPAKLIVVGMCANSFTIADPNDPGMLDVVGFDTTVPQAMEQFIVG